LSIRSSLVVDQSIEFILFEAGDQLSRSLTYTHNIKHMIFQIIVFPIHRAFSTHLCRASTLASMKNGNGRKNMKERIYFMADRK
jgi:hypothetical protein